MHQEANPNVAKRNRGGHRQPGRTAARPRTAATQTRPTRPAATARTQAVPAAALADEALVTEDLLEADEPRTTRGTAAARSRAKPSAVLAARAATEYVYVAQDLRRIAVVAAVLFGVMFALWVLIVVVGILPH